MFLKTGSLALALLLLSRLLGLLRESALAAAFGTSAAGDLAVLMLTLPDWLSGVLVSGALSYVLLPHWSGQSPSQIAALQRRVATVLMLGGSLVALAMALASRPLLNALAAGLPPALQTQGMYTICWSALALPAALLSSLWVARLQFERDFLGMYTSNLVVNAVLITALVWLTYASSFHGLETGELSLWILGGGLCAAVLLRLLWLRWRLTQTHQPLVQNITFDQTKNNFVNEVSRKKLSISQLEPPNLIASAETPSSGMPAASLWLWAALSAGLPITLPFMARSWVSASGAGELVVFNYAWKLVELPLVLAIQLVATIALPAIAKSVADPSKMVTNTRTAVMLAWTLACVALLALQWAAQPLATLLFAWGRMNADAVVRVGVWSSAGAWSLLPQALIAVSMAVLAALKRLHVSVGIYALGLVALLVAQHVEVLTGERMMWHLSMIYTVLALLLSIFLSLQIGLSWLPWCEMLIPLGLLFVALWWKMYFPTMNAGMNILFPTSGAVLTIIVVSVIFSPTLRRAVRR